MLKRVGSLFRSQNLIALGGIAALEFCFVLLYRLHDLEIHIIETIAIAFTRNHLFHRAVLPGARRGNRRRCGSFWPARCYSPDAAPLAPTLSEDIYRYGWDGLVTRRLECL